MHLYLIWLSCIWTQPWHKNYKDALADVLKHVLDISRENIHLCKTSVFISEIRADLFVTVRYFSAKSITFYSY